MEVRRESPQPGVSEEIKLLNRINSENLESPRIA